MLFERGEQPATQALTLGKVFFLDLSCLLAQTRLLSEVRQRRLQAVPAGNGFMVIAVCTRQLPLCGPPGGRQKDADLSPLAARMLGHLQRQTLNFQPSSDPMVRGRELNVGAA